MDYGTKVVEEMKIWVAYYEKETGQPANLLGIALSARRNLCIHPEVWNMFCDDDTPDLICF